MTYDVDFIEAVTDETTSEVPLYLLKLVIPGHDETIRLVNNDEDIISNGKTFEHFAFELSEAARGGGARSVAKLRIANFDKRIPETIADRASGRPIVTIQQVLASKPDKIQRELTGYNLTNVVWDTLWVEGFLSTPDDQDEPVTSKSFTPRTAPGLFRQ